MTVNSQYGIVEVMPPYILTADAVTCNVGDPFTFLISASGYPTANISITNLPGWLTLTQNQTSESGTVANATISGTPPMTGAVVSTVYEFVITAANAEGSVNQAFTLTAMEAPETPQTAVSPITAPLSTGSEILVPFQIDPATGGVAYTSSYVQIEEQHIASIVNTALNERVMLPSYGTVVPNEVFAPNSPLVRAQIASSIQQAISKWESAVTLQAVQVTEDPTNSAVINVTILFTVQPLPQTNSVTVSLGGPLYQVLTS